MRCVSAAVLCVVLAVSAPAFAQERAWFFFSDNVFTEVAVDNGGRTWSPLRRLTLPPHYGRTVPILSAGGRFIVWTGARNPYEPPTLLALDTRTGQLHTFPNITLQSRDWTIGVPLANDRRSGRLVARDDVGVYLIDLHGRTPLLTISLPRLGRRSDFLATGRGRIFVGWQGDSFNTLAPHITVIDGTTGAIIAELPDASRVVLSADERRVYALGIATLSGTTVTGYDTETLARVSQGVLPTFTTPSVINGVFVTWGGRVVPTGTYTANLFPVFYAYDQVTFALLGQFAPPLVYQTTSYGSSLTFSTGFGGATLYVKSYAVPVSEYFSDCESPRIDIFDLQTLGYLGTVDPTQFGNPCKPFRYLAPPDSPTRLRTAIVNGAVHLEWDPPADITDYEIVVGSRPDTIDIGEFRTYGKAFADFQGAPSGTYYVRVRARNELGAAESAQIKVVVP
jgi:hypothetical protein